MERSKEFIERDAFKRFALAYQAVIAGRLKSNHGIVFCPYCNDQLVQDQTYRKLVYKCQNEECPFCMMLYPIHIKGYDPAVSLRKAEKKEEVKSEPKPEPKPEPAIHTQRAEKEEASGEGLKSWQQASNFKQVEPDPKTQKEKDACKAAALGVVPIKRSYVNCPYCGDRLRSNSSKVKKTGLHRRTFKCKNPGCYIAKNNVVINSFEDKEAQKFCTIKPPVNKHSPEYLVDKYIADAPPIDTHNASKNYKTSVAIEIQKYAKSRSYSPEDEKVAGKKQHLVFDRRLYKYERPAATRVMQMLSKVHPKPIQKEVDRIAKKANISTYRALKHFTYATFPHIYKKVWGDQYPK